LRLPVTGTSIQGVEAGQLLYFGPSLVETYRRCAEYVDQVLRGADPANLPIEQPTKFELAFNLRTAKALM
jgi:putative ABC transport system substrate-binding protein